MKRVAIVGAGEIGAAVARALAEHEIVREIRLIDQSSLVASGKALDILQSGPLEGSDTRVIGAPDLDAVVGTDVVVIADRHGAAGEWTGTDAAELLRRLVPLAGRCPLIAAGPQYSDLLRVAHRELGVDARRLIGSAAEALASAARALTGAASGASPVDASVPVLGVPGRWVFGWTDARIGSAPVSARLAPVAIARIESQVAASWPPGPYALGSAAASVLHTIVYGRLRQATVFTPVEHTLDIRRAVVAVPVSLDASGVKAVQWPALSVRERVMLEGALTD